MASTRKERAVDVRSRLFEQRVVRPGEAGERSQRDPRSTGGPDFAARRRLEAETS
jgi:hypothetical protein